MFQICFPCQHWESKPDHHQGGQSALIPGPCCFPLSFGLSSFLGVYMVICLIISPAAPSHTCLPFSLWLVLSSSGVQDDISSLWIVLSSSGVQDDIPSLWIVLSSSGVQDDIPSLWIVLSSSGVQDDIAPLWIVLSSSGVQDNIPSLWIVLSSSGVQDDIPSLWIVLSSSSVQDFIQSLWLVLSSSGVHLAAPLTLKLSIYSVSVNWHLAKEKDHPLKHCTSNPWKSIYTVIPLFYWLHAMWMIGEFDQPENLVC